MMNDIGAINYIEWPAKDIAATKAFFEEVFSWQFVDYGPEYTSFENAGTAGGFYQSDNSSTMAHGGALIVFYNPDLDGIRATIERHGGRVNVEPFAFPGGHRFHFIEPSGNEFAVWSDQYVLE